jgi:hypothetical protein
MTFHRKSKRLVLAGAVAALVVPAGALAKPIPSASPVQIGGELVPPSQLSTWQANATQVRPESQLVQVGGQLVPPSQVSSAQQQLSRDGSATLTTSDDGVNWSAAGAGIAGFVVLIGAAGYVVQARRRLTTA